MTYAPTYGINYFKQVGTSPIEAWYYNSAWRVNQGTSSVAVDTIRAYPWFCPRGGTLDRLSFRVTTAGAAGADGRVGIYTNTGDNNPYPNALVVDGGEMAVDSTGVKTATISTVIAPGMYWFAYLCGTSAPTLRSSVVGVVLNSLPSKDAAYASNWHTAWTKAQSYGALPATFPASASTALGAAAPNIAVRFSA